MPANSRWDLIRAFKGERPSLYRAVNTFHLGYKNQSVYAASGTCRCLFSDKYKTHKYSVDRAYSCWMLNLLVHHVTSRLWKVIAKRELLSGCKAVWTANSSCERVEQFKYFGTNLTNQNFIQEEFKSRLKSGNAYYHSVQNLLSSSLLSTNIAVKLNRTTILPCGLVWVWNLVAHIKGGI